MMHRPIHFKNVSLSFPHKVCFEDFSSSISYGNRIAIIGCIGCGKSTLLQMILGIVEPTDGELKVPEDIVTGYVPQVIEEFESLSGGEALNASLSQALSNDPNLLVLDEPSNHLDLKNRKSLIRMLQVFPGTLIFASHDVELLQNCVENFWHIDNGRIHQFSGSYDDYIREISIKRTSIKLELTRLKRDKKEIHQTLMNEQKRAKNSQLRGKKSIRERKWPTIVSDEKARRAIETSGKISKAIQDKKEVLINKLSELKLPNTIRPKFSINASELGKKTLLSVSNGSIGYKDNLPLLSNLCFLMKPGDRLAIIGNNGSGKSTLVKAILGDANIIKTGFWQTPKIDDIGYLDQYYKTLSSDKTVFENIRELVPIWSYINLRRHLNDFLFSKNEEVEILVSKLSGGEKARLSLAQIAAKTPKILILDEVTNNIDLQTREHVIQVVKNYPGALIVISHDEDFLKEIELKEIYQINNGTMSNLDI